MTPEQFEILKEWIKAEVRAKDDISIEGELQRLSYEQDAYAAFVLDLKQLD